MLFFTFRYTPTLFATIFTLLLAFNTSAQDEIVVTVVGNGEPLIGATVQFVDTKGNPVSDNIGSITEYDGSVTIPKLRKEDIVVFDYTGYETLKINYGQLSNTNFYPGYVVTMKVAENILSEIIVVAPSKFEEKEASVPTIIQRITREEMEEKASQTSAEVLEDAGIFVQRSQAGGGSPIIRGFEANKVLIVVDGVRMNNAIYRSGHLQNVITVDNSMLEQMEVLYGPSAVVYGSDALGGVLYMQTKDPLLSPVGKKELGDTTNANAYLRYASSNNSITTHLDFGSGNRKFGSMTSLSFSRFGDIVSGKRAPKWDGNDSIPENWLRNQYVGISNNDDIVIDGTFGEINPYLQRGTSYGQNTRIGYWQLDFMQKFGIRPKPGKFHILNFQFSTSNNIQRYDQLSKLKNGKPKFAEWYYGPQKRILFSHTARILKEKGKMFNRALFITAYQNIGEDRYQRKLNNLLLERNFVDVNVFSFNADFMKNLNKNESQTIFYGTEMTYNNVVSEADFTNVLTKEVILGRNPTRYGNDGNSMTTAAFYANYRADIKSKDQDGETGPNSPTLFRLLAGLRYTYASTVANYKITEYALELPFEQAKVTGSNMTGAIGLSFTPKDWAFKASFSTGYRVPNVDDLAKFREKDGFVTIPNPDLKPEYGLNYEFNAAKTFRFGQEENGVKSSSITASANIFYTKLLNAIVRKRHHLPDRDTTINDVQVVIPGDSTFTFEGTTADVVINTNAAEAKIFGYSLNLKMNLNDKFFFSAGFNDIKGTYTSGIIDDEEVNSDTLRLSHIPPSYGHLSFAYQFRSNQSGKKWKRFKTEILYRFNGVKPLSEYDQSSGNSDNLDDAIEEFGTPRWATWNWYNTWQFSRKFSLNFNIENITDLHYRVFSSGISAPGRNFIITLKGTF